MASLNPDAVLESPPSFRGPGRGLSVQVAAAQPIWPLVCILYASLLPSEVHVLLGGQYLYAPRILSILLLPWILIHLLRGTFRVHLADAGVLLGCAWMVLSFAVYYGTVADTMRAVAIVFDMAIPYLLARMSITSFFDLRRTLILFAPGIFIAGALLVVESISHTAIVKPLASAIFGNLPQFESGGVVAASRDYEGFRFGLLRASGGFPHPILAGLYLVSSLTIYAMSRLRGWPMFAGIAAGLTAFFTVSSTAFLSFFLFLIFMIYDRIQRITSFLSWRRFMLITGIPLFVLQFGSKNGVIAILGRYALDPQTAFYRKLIWQYGTQSVFKHPWFGIGFTSYERLPWMVESIDNYWLLLAVRHGFLAPVLILCTVIPTIWLLAMRGIRRSEDDRMLSVGLASSLFMMTLLVFTVAIFGGFTAWFYSVLGLSLSAALSPIKPDLTHGRSR
ncbi:hypothetical protein B2G71_19190 [Novosphingobium sp. PC22D]|uniref:hypothetical protein n=1 Tax=Novosphingobium sp. PC22D TaxID=1962403 RepID=UPI000BEF8FC1|nr:hypothetical protein [Novosphingobium sp. PC22D]PEQ10947.1 hypothetical protein B2G71_19190 [Novosphingobium sp. PC22D]